MTGREGEPRLAGAAQTNFEAVSGMPQPDCPMTIVQTALMSHGTCACITRCLLHVARVPCVVQCSDRRPEIKFRKVPSHNKMPGMPVEAFIRTDERTMLSYLFKPLTDQARRAFREK